MTDKQETDEELRQRRYRERAGETDTEQRQEAARSARMQAALRSDTVNMLHGELRLGKP